MTTGRGGYRGRRWRRVVGTCKIVCCAFGCYRRRWVFGGREGPGRRGIDGLCCCSLGLLTSSGTVMARNRPVMMLLL